MKIHGSYNVFDGEELLLDSILYNREILDVVTVIFQEKSNYGEDCDPNLKEFLFDLKKKKYIDNLALFTPNLSKHPHQNELAKNNYGYNLAISSKCDYHMSLACDEFYIKDEFNDIKKFISKYKVDLVTSYMYTYYKSNRYRFKNIENYVVPVLNKVYNNQSYILGSKCHVSIDPTRIMNYNSSVTLPKTNPIMHHYSHVRKNYRKKLENSSAKQNWYQYIEKCVKEYETWKPDSKAFIYDRYEELEFTNTFKKEIIF